jgi:hypothetical protein
MQPTWIHITTPLMVWIMFPLARISMALKLSSMPLVPLATFQDTTLPMAHMMLSVLIAGHATMHRAQLTIMALPVSIVTSHLARHILIRQAII